MCRDLGNQLGAARGDAHVDEIYEGGIAAGCWTRAR